MTDINDVSKYWQGKNIPQQWYSTKDPFSIQWFNEVAHKRYNVYYEYLKESAEFSDHQNEKVLEVGVGLGTDLVQYAKNGAFVYGVDLGQNQIEYTKLNFKANGLRYEELKKANAECLPFLDNTFDLVYSFGVLHHSPDTEQTVSEVHRVLKDDGQAIIMLYARGWKHYLKRCLIHGILKGKYFKYGSWQEVYNDASEVNGGSPKTGVYTKNQINELFSEFSYIEISKKRMGEFFEYRPYKTYILPTFIRNLTKFFLIESYLGENWLIKAYKSPKPHKAKLSDVILKHY